jgi:hypothetical protein
MPHHSKGRKTTAYSDPNDTQPLPSLDHIILNETLKNHIIWATIFGKKEWNIHFILSQGGLPITIARKKVVFIFMKPMSLQQLKINM